MAKSKQSLAERVSNIVLSQGMRYLPAAIDTLGELAENADKEHTRVVAAKTLISVMETASEGMTEDRAGGELLKALQEAEHLSNVTTDVPKAFRDME